MMRRTETHARNILLGGPLLALVTACIPYTVGTTATPVAEGERAATVMMFAMPSVNLLDSARADRPSSVSRLAVDGEMRWGLDARSDFGVRYTSGTGVVVNYKRLLSDTGSGTLVAIMPGAGIVNAAQHGHVELTLLASGREAGSPRARGRGSIAVAPYGGLRVMQVLPLAEGAVRDRPTAGAFFGARFGQLDFGVSPEIGVFYDHSAMRVRKRDVIVVPAISFHGERLIAALGDVIRMLPRGGVLMRNGPR